MPQTESLDISALRTAFGNPSLDAKQITLQGDRYTILSQEAVVQSQLDLADLKPGHKVLEVGFGTGYLCARTAQIVGDSTLVYGIDVLDETVALAQNNLNRVGLTDVHLMAGNGLAGWPEDQVFDRIVVSCGVTEFPWNCARQLAEGGILVVPIERGWPFGSVLLAVQKQGDQLVAVRAAVGYFMSAVGRDAPTSLLRFPVVSVAEGLECEVHLASETAGSQLRNMDAWQQSEPPTDAVTDLAPLFQCAAVLALLYPRHTCFISVQGLSPLGVGLYCEEPVGVACVRWSADPVTPNRFGPIIWGGDPKAKQLLEQVILRAATASSHWLDGVQRIWSVDHPWRADVDGVDTPSPTAWERAG